MRLLPSPTKLPENIEPEIAATFVKSTTSVEPETVSEPVILAEPFLEPSHSAVIPVRLVPSPWKEPLNDPLTPPLNST